MSAGCLAWGGWGVLADFAFSSQLKRRSTVCCCCCSDCVYGEREGGLTAQLPNGTLLQGNLLLHPDFSKMWHNRERDAGRAPLLTLQNAHKHTHTHTPLICVSTHRLKCSIIFSSRTFSGKFPTHKCLVSRTILCAPAPRSYRWVCYVRFSPCKIQKLCKINGGQEKRCLAQIIDCSLWPNVNH